MGFLGGLVGQKKLIGTVEIKFYTEEKVSVQYKSEATSKFQIEKDLIQLFAFYYCRTLSNLGRGNEAEMLINYIDTAVQQLLAGGDKRLIILGTGLELADLGSDPVKKTYSGELYEKSDKRFVNTRSTSVGEGYYAPVAVIMFFQYLINNLSMGLLQFLVFSVGGINKYYREVGNYWSMTKVYEAANFGLDLAVKFFSDLESQNKS